MKTFAVVVSDAAEADLLAIYDYIANRAGPTVAFDYIARIEDYVRRFTIAPQRGTARGDLGRGVRTVGFERSATVLFQVDAQARMVVILGVYYRGRNFEAE